MTTCATCKYRKLLNRLDKDARAMARLDLLNCAHGKSWEFLPPNATCPKHEPADAQTVAARQRWLAK